MEILYISFKGLYECHSDMQSFLGTTDFSSYCNTQSKGDTATDY
jgi:tRNA U38,U39,U40 pseudouridine synthase TruA